MKPLFWGSALLLLIACSSSTDPATSEASETAEETPNTLSTVQTRGVLNCGISRGLAGFSALNASEIWEGLDVDYCKAIAAATLGDATKVEYVSLSPTERFTSLAAGEIDVLARNSTWTQSRDTTLEVLFAATNFFDGQAIMVPSALSISAVSDLKSVEGQLTVCQVAGTTSSSNLEDYFTANSITPAQFLSATDSTDARSQYEAGTCNLYTTDQSGLISIRAALPTPSDHVILTGLISEEPLSLAVRDDDPNWFRIVRWTHYVLLRAELHGIQSSNLATFDNSSTPEVLRIIGAQDSLGENLGLEADWAHQVLQAVGNYGEVFTRHLGPSTPFNLSRGENALWTQGGLQFAPPYR